MVMMESRVVIVTLTISFIVSVVSAADLCEYQRANLGFLLLNTVVLYSNSVCLSVCRTSV